MQGFAYDFTTLLTEITQRHRSGQPPADIG
jgi:hypothetical protein